jgi:hypothetical protein
MVSSTEIRSCPAALLSRTIVAFANIGQEKFSNATIALKNDRCPAIGKLQKLHQGRTQDFVQADKFLSLFAQPRRRADG